MKSWTVHLHDTRPPVLVKEGFAWGALAAGPFWFARHRAWILAVLALACAALCIWQIGRRGMRPVLVGVGVVIAANVLGLGVLPSAMQRLSGSTSATFS